VARRAGKVRRIAGTCVFTTGVAGRVQCCFDKKSGKLLWTEQLWTTIAVRG